MMRSLYSGVAGLKTHQIKMDVIGNNIANVNTVGFKSSTVLFQDVLYQTTQSATGANAATGAGGTNAKQIGLGSELSTISSSITSSGSTQTTNNPYDLKLDANSLFIVNKDGINYFTKVGSFKTDSAGNLVNGAGNLVMGWQVDPEDPSQIKKDTVSALSIESVENKYSSPEMTSKTYLTGNLDKEDTDLASTEGVVQTVTLMDNLGYSYTAKIGLTKYTPTAAEVAAGTYTGKSTYKASLLSVKNENNVNILAAGNGYSATFGANPAIVEFDADSGEFIAVDSTADADANDDAIKLTITPTSTAFGDVFSTTETPTIDVDFSNIKNYADGGESSITWKGGGTDGNGKGRTKGELADVSIGTDGKIYGVYSNSVTMLLGQIAVAQFTNPAGLEAVGGSLYKATQNSGTFDGIGQEASGMTQGVLEMSNVDLSAEFTDMIVTQRGFQANSRIITVSDTLLEELINLKR